MQEKKSSNDSRTGFPHVGFQRTCCPRSHRPEGVRAARVALLGQEVAQAHRAYVPPIYFQAGRSLRWDSASLCQSITLSGRSRQQPPGPFLGLSGGCDKSPGLPSWQPFSQTRNAPLARFSTLKGGAAGASAGHVLFQLLLADLVLEPTAAAGVKGNVSPAPAAYPA